MRSSWLALGVLLSITLLGWCRDDARPRPARPSLLWVMSDYVAAWRSGSTIYIQHERDNPRPRSVYSNRTLHGEPTLQRRTHGYVLGAIANDPRDHDWRSEVAVCLDHWGKPDKRRVVRRHIVSADRSCEVRQSLSDHTVTAFISEPRDDGRAWFLGIGTIDDDLEPGTSAMLITLDRPVSCMVATRGDVAVWVIRFAHSISIHFHDLRDLKREGADLEITDVADNTTPWDLSVTPAFDSAKSFAVLHRDRAGLMHVTHFNPSGILDTEQLDDDVDGATADLGASLRGLFVAWVTGRELHVRGITQHTTATRRVPALSSIRTIGVFDTCMVAVRPPTGNRVLFESFDDCP